MKHLAGLVTGLSLTCASVSVPWGTDCGFRLKPLSSTNHPSVELIISVSIRAQDCQIMGYSLKDGSSRVSGIVCTGGFYIPTMDSRS